MTQSIGELRRDVDAIKELIQSRGWAILKEIQEREIVQAARMMGAGALSGEQLQFQSGAIWAANQLLDMPEKALMRLEGDLRVQTAMIGGTGT